MATALQIIRCAWLRPKNINLTLFQGYHTSFWPISLKCQILFSSQINCCDQHLNVLFSRYFIDTYNFCGEVLSSCELFSCFNFTLHLTIDKYLWSDQSVFSHYVLVCKVCADTLFTYTPWDLHYLQELFSEGWANNAKGRRPSPHHCLHACSLGVARVCSPFRCHFFIQIFCTHLFSGLD